MRELRYRDITAADCADLLRLYCHSFPADERRVYDGVQGFRSFLNANSDKFHPLVITLDGRFAGFLTYWEFPGYVYVEHFAVEPEMRGNDIGGSTLRHLVENISDRVLLEVEHPDTPEARRRRRDARRQQRRPQRRPHRRRTRCSLPHPRPRRHQHISLVRRCRRRGASGQVQCEGLSSPRRRAS